MAAATTTSLFLGVFRHDAPSPVGKSRSNRIQSITPPRFAVSVDRAAATSMEATSPENRVPVEREGGRGGGVAVKEEEEEERSTLSGWKEYLEEAKVMVGGDGGGRGGGPPRWLSPLECGSRLENSPLLLYLPGIDGVGVGLILHHQKLGRIFDIWCLHIPVADRTPFTGLLKIVERTVRSENQRSPNKPIYLVGESLGACLAMAVAARNPDIDLVLILGNPER